MEIIETLEELHTDRPSAVTLGKFDGLHTAHRALVDRVVTKNAECGLLPVIVSFDIFPVRILTEKEKEAMLEKAGIGLCVRLPFTTEIMTMSAGEFIEEVLIRRMNASYVCVGDDFRFGYQRRGDVAYLAEEGKKRGITVEIVPAIFRNGREISSTWVRECLKDGNAEEAAELLGYPYFISGTIVHGRSLGHTIGVPTVNLIPEEAKLLPRYGVYFSRNTIGGETYYGITNVGTKPTVEGNFPGVETHLFDVSSDFYGREIRTELLSFMRPEKRFSSVDDLKKQLEADIKKGKALEIGA